MHLISMEEHTFSLGYKMGGVMDSTLTHINDLPIPIPIPIHQRSLISSIVDYSSLTRVQEDTSYGTDRWWYKDKKTNTWWNVSNIKEKMQTKRLHKLHI